jgi:hypothetical protein
LSWNLLHCPIWSQNPGLRWSSHLSSWNYRHSLPHPGYFGKCSLIQK